MISMFHNKILSGPPGPSGADGNPIGTVISYMGLTAPKDYLVCDGAEYSISEYSELAELFKEQFGSTNYFGGDGETTFAVPDLRNLFLRGYHGESSKQLSGEIGEKQEATKIPGTWTNKNNNSFGTFSFDDPLGNHITPVNVDTQDKASVYTVSTSQYLNSSNLEGFSGETSALYTSRPLNMAVLYCIKALKSAPAQNFYSTEETRIGTWIDGKPLYRKLWSLNIVLGENYKNTRIVYISDLHIKELVRGFAKYHNSSYEAGQGTIGGAGATVCANYQYTELYIYTSGVSGSTVDFVWIEYTKTTD